MNNNINQEIMYNKKLLSPLLIILSLFFYFKAEAQVKKPQNQPYADQKMYHAGFLVGIHTQDLIFKHTGNVTTTGESWFAEIPSYSVGFSVGILGDRYLNEYFNLRFAPTLYFGERHFVFKEQASGKTFEETFRSNMIAFPLSLKFSAGRMNNYRPYFLAGGYGSIDITPVKNKALRFNQVDYGLEFGIGCNFYLPMFKLCPELKFSFGLADLINKNNLDLNDKDLLMYREAIGSGQTRMISLVFNFE